MRKDTEEAEDTEEDHRGAASVNLLCVLL